MKFRVPFIIMSLLVSCSSTSSEKVLFYNFWHFQERKEADFPKLCVSAHTDIFSDYQKELDMLYELQFDIIRRDFIWKEIEPTEGNYDNYVVEKYERFVSEVRRRNIELLYLVIFGNYWASEESKKCLQECTEKNQDCSYCDKFPPDPSKYAKFAKFVVQRFSAKYIEVWNEPNWIFFMNPVSPEKYAQILSETYRAVKDLNTTVILGGLLSADVQLPKDFFIKPDDFLSSYPFDDFFDVLGIHPYIGRRGVSYPPTLPPENSSMAYAPLPAIISGLQKITKKDIWITEMGWPSYSDGVSEFAQANYITRAIFMSAMMGIKTFCVYEFVDSYWNTSHPAEAHFGVIKQDYSPKPAYVALKRFSRFKDTKYKGSVKLESPESIVFSPLFSGASSSIVVWAVDTQGMDLSEKVNVKLFVNPEVVLSASDIFGETVSYTKGKDYILLSVGSTPIIIDVKF